MIIYDYNAQQIAKLQQKIKDKRAQQEKYHFFCSSNLIF